MNQVVADRESVASNPVTRAQPAAAPCEPGFHFFVESLAGGPAGGSRAAPPAAADLPVLAVPAGVTFLSPSRNPLALVSRRPRAAALVLEPVQVEGRARLLLLTPNSLRARLNGQAVPVLALLRVGDQLQLDAQAILHVTEYRGAGAVSPSPELVGSPCGVCRLPLAAETTVYLCHCGLPLHLEGPPKPEGERLECAYFGDCPSCGAEVQRESGYVWVPEL